MGRTEQAKAQLAEALRQNPDLAARPRHYLGNYIFPHEVIERIMDGLRKAGLPDRGAKAEGQSPSIERDQDGIVATAWLSGAGWEGSRHTHIAA